MIFILGKASKLDYTFLFVKGEGRREGREMKGGKGETGVKGGRKHW